MNKQEAAQFLGVSEKTLERIVKKGEISARHERTKAGRIVTFDDDELTKYRETRQAGVLFPAMVKNEPQSLVAPLVGQSDGQANLLAALASFADAQNLTAISHKLTLTLDEAVQLSGLSKATLRAAIKDEKLKTFQGQRGSKNIRRADLDNFISSL
jgi:excisionase family DNA binding protein